MTTEQELICDAIEGAIVGITTAVEKSDITSDQIYALLTTLFKQLKETIQ